MSIEIKEGTCLKISEKDKIIEAICVQVVQNKACFEHFKQAYVCLCYENYGNVIENKMETLKLMHFSDETLEEKEWEIIPNMHFFTISELTEILMEIPGYMTLLGTAHCYGDNFYDDKDEDERGEQVFLQSGINYFEIIIPKELYYNDSYTIPYFYVKKSRKANIDEDAGEYLYEYKTYNEEFDPEELTEKIFLSFMNEAYEGIHIVEDESNNVQGIKLGNIIIYDFPNNDGVISFGNGLLEMDKYKY